MSIQRLYRGSIASGLAMLAFLLIGSVGNAAFPDPATNTLTDPTELLVKDHTVTQGPVVFQVEKSIQQSTRSSNEVSNAVPLVPFFLSSLISYKNQVATRFLVQCAKALAIPLAPLSAPRSIAFNDPDEPHAS